MTPRLIDLGNPVSGHPHNQGLVSWWLPLPNNSGGGTLFDICSAKRNELALTNFAWPGTATSGWTAGPHGFGALAFDGSDDYATSSVQPIASADNVIVECVVNPASLPQNGCIFSIGCVDGGGPNGASTSPVLLMYQKGLEQGNPDVAAAIGLILVVLVLTLALIERRAVGDEES